MVTLRELYLADLSELVDAEEQILRELPVMSARASSVELQALFDEHYRDTQRHAERLQRLFDRMDERPRASVCRAVRGLVEDARERQATWERGDVLDAALVGAAQRLEHYEMAAYGCVRTYAAALGDEEAVSALQQTLDEEGRADHRLSTLADRDINPRAKNGRTVSTFSASASIDLWTTDTTAIGAAPRRDEVAGGAHDNELMVARGEPEWRSDELEREQRAARRRDEGT